MSITTRIEAFMPKLSHLKSEIAQQIKAMHPKKVLVRNWGRMVQAMRVVAFHARRVAHGIADRIPRVQITTRRVIQVKTEGTLLGNRIKAKSKEGLQLTPSQLELVKDNPSFVRESRDVEKGGQPAKADFLVKVKSDALKSSEREFEAALEEYVQARTALDAKDLKTPVDKNDREGWEARVKERKTVSDLATKMLGIEKKHVDLRALATQLKLKEIGGQHDTKAALRDALRFHAKAEALKLSDASSLVKGVANSVASVTQDRLDIDTRLKEISAKYRHKVYKDIKAFIENENPNSEHNTLVRAQRNRQVIKGTDKLHFATASNGFKQRLPGLDYYMCAARQRWPAGEEVFKDGLVREAVRLMHNDWALFGVSVEDEINKIKVDDTETTPGSFDADKMWEYHHLKSFQSTMAKLKELARHDKHSDSRMVDFLSSYGEELGLGEHPGYNLDTLTNDAKSKYSVTNGFTLLSDSVEKPELGVGVEVHPDSQPIAPYPAEVLRTPPPSYNPFSEVVDKLPLTDQQYPPATQANPFFTEDQRDLIQFPDDERAPLIPPKDDKNPFT